MESIYGKGNPFKASIKERMRLTSSLSEKETYHIILDLSGSGLAYQPGDSVVLYSANNPKLVQQTLEALKASGSEIIYDNKGSEYILHEYLTSKANLSDIGTQLFSFIHKNLEKGEKKEYFDWLVEEENRSALKDFLGNFEVWDFLNEHEEVRLTTQDIATVLLPLRPRFYSIASSQNVVGDEVHLTVVLKKYTMYGGRERLGVCTSFLCHLAPLQESIVPIYIQPHHGFGLPQGTHLDIIMVGAGTGVAPFRAFMQERLCQKGKGRNWLFFGEQCADSTYLYRDYWMELQDCGHLRLDTAFSRDQSDKIYVQHRMVEKGQEMFQWLESGAYFYVCGDAKRMAKDVEAALLRIIEIHGAVSPAAAMDYLKKLRAQGKYLRDIY
jgi:sulfite reductase (NADPH) flavoprotein alpha-component